MDFRTSESLLLRLRVLFIIKIELASHLTEKMYYTFAIETLEPL